MCFGFIDSSNISHDLTHFRMKQSLREIVNLLSAIVIVKLLIVNCYRLDLQRPDCRSLSAYRKAWQRCGGTFQRQSNTPRVLFLALAVIGDKRGWRGGNFVSGGIRQSCVPQELRIFQTRRVSEGIWGWFSREYVSVVSANAVHRLNPGILASRLHDSGACRELLSGNYSNVVATVVTPFTPLFDP